MMLWGQTFGQRIELRSAGFVRDVDLFEKLTFSGTQPRPPHWTKPMKINFRVR
jgi:hypothetical protein